MTTEQVKRDDSFPFEFTDGLTKREYFAALALQGLLANPNNGPLSCKSHEQLKPPMP